MPLDPAYPWASNPRTFRAAAMPNGEARFGIEGQLVFLCEQRGHCVDKVKYLSRAEAEQLRDAINEALHAFDLVKDFAGSIASEIGARACTAPYPFRDHRTLADFEASTRSRTGEAGTTSAAVGPLGCPPREEAPALTGDDRR